MAKFNVRRQPPDDEPPEKWRQRIERKLEKHATYWQVLIALAGIAAAGLIPRLFELLK